MEQLIYAYVKTSQTQKKGEVDGNNKARCTIVTMHLSNQGTS